MEAKRHSPRSSAKKDPARKLDLACTNVVRVNVRDEMNECGMEEEVRRLSLGYEEEEPELPGGANLQKVRINSVNRSEQEADSTETDSDSGSLADICSDDCSCPLCTRHFPGKVNPMKDGTDESSECVCLVGCMCGKRAGYCPDKPASEEVEVNCLQPTELMRVQLETAACAIEGLVDTACSSSLIQEEWVVGEIEPTTNRHIRGLKGITVAAVEAGPPGRGAGSRSSGVAAHQR